jgi:hypothetical protein
VAATSVGEIALDLVVNQNQFNKQMKGIASLAKKVGLALATAFSVKKIVDFGKECLELGSDLAEVQNVVDVTFPTMTSKVDEFAQSAINSFGLSETMAKQYTGTFGAMAKAFGFTEEQAYDMSSTLTGLAGDVASFYNITQDEAYTKLKSVFTGETESLKDLGVVMTQSALDSYALANGFGKTTSAMSEAEKVALRYQFVQDKLSAAQGDFARTSGSWANQVRILKLQFDSLKATIGQGLINLFTPIIKVVNTVIGKLATLANAFKAFTELITGQKSSSSSSSISEVGNAADTASDGLTDATDAADDLTDSTSAAGKAAKKAAQQMRALMGFDKIDKLSDQTSDSSDSGDTDGTSAAGSTVDFGSLAQGETVIDEVDSKFTKMFENIKNLCEPAVQSLQQLWNEGLAKLGNFAWTALKDFYSGFLVPVGKWTLGTGIPRFVDALNNGLMKVDFQKLNDSLKKLWNALAPFAIHVGEGLLWFWEKVLVPLGIWGANEVVPRFLNTLSIAINALNRIIEALQPLFQWFWDSVLQPIARWTGGVFLTIWDGINDALQKFSDWCTDNPGTIQTITIVIASFFAAFKIASLIKKISSLIKSFAGMVSAVEKIGALVGSVWNPWVLALTAVIAAGVLVYKNWDTIKTKAIEIWGAIRDWFEKTIEKIKGFFTGLWSGIKETFADVGGWFEEKFSRAYTNVQNAFSGTRKFFDGVWTGIQNAFGNVSGWFETTFAKAWKKVKEVFSTGGKVFDGIKEGILNGLKSVINSLIRGINRVITIPFNGLNSALQGMKDVEILNMHPFSFLPTISIPQIPQLAMGGFVKKNTPQLAMIGDNRHQGEVVAPEDKLQAMVDEAVSRASGSGITREELESIMNNAVMRIIAALSSVGFNLDGTQVATLQRMAQTSIDRRFNTVEIT